MQFIIYFINFVVSSFKFSVFTTQQNYYLSVEIEAWLANLGEKQLPEVQCSSVFAGLGIFKSLQYSRPLSILPDFSVFTFYSKYIIIE